MRFPVTGGAGFIGSHITEELLRRGHQVRVLDNFSTGKRDNLRFAADSPDIEIVEADIRDFESVVRLADGVQGIFHQAALVSVSATIEQPRLSFEINAKGTFNVLEAARQNKTGRVVYASSAAVYGDNDTLPLAETLRRASINCSTSCKKSPARLWLLSMRRRARETSATLLRTYPASSRNLAMPLLARWVRD